jgi:hypothetical protein
MISKKNKYPSSTSYRANRSWSGSRIPICVSGMWSWSFSYSRSQSSSTSGSKCKRWSK